MAFMAFVPTLCTWLRLMFLNPSFLPILTKTHTYSKGWVKAWFEEHYGEHVYRHMCECENLSLSLLEKS